MADLNSTIVRGNLRVTDDAKVNGNTTVNGNITAGTATVGGNATVSGNLTVSGTITGSASGLTDLPELLDTNVKLSSALTIYYPVGKYKTTNSTTGLLQTPKTYAANTSIRDMLNDLFVAEVDNNITVNAPTVSISPSNKSVEYGGTISSTTFTVSFNPGSYEYGPATGVTANGNYTVKVKNSSNAEIQSGTTTFSGTGNKTINFNTQTVTNSTITLTATVSYPHTASTANAKNNLGQEASPVVNIASGTKEASGSFTLSPSYYTYYRVTSTSSDPGKSGWTKYLDSNSNPVSATSPIDLQLSASAGQYIWIACKVNGSVYEWNGVSGEYNISPTEFTKLSSKTLTLATSTDCSGYYFYCIPRAGNTDKKFKVA